MSVKELVLGNSPLKLRVTKVNEQIFIEMRDIKAIGAVALDRNQAHLLMLYLQEHLK